MDSTNPNGESHGSIAQTQIHKISKLNPHAQEWVGIKNKKLNPNALEWNRAKHDDRCIFIRFSKYNSPTAKDLTTYFQKTYGDCVQSVAMLGANEGQESLLCAKVVFKLSSIPTLLLATSDEMNLFINGKSILCKRYQPKPKKKQHQDKGSIQNVE